MGDRKQKSCAAGLCHEDGVTFLEVSFVKSYWTAQRDRSSLCGRAEGVRSTRWVSLWKKTRMLELVGVFRFVFDSRVGVLDTPVQAEGDDDVG